MSLDQTLERLIQFRSALQDFVDELRRAQSAVEHAEEALLPLWRDAFQQEFQARYSEFSGPVRQFLAHDAGAYIGFLDKKIVELRGYFDGGR